MPTAFTFAAQFGFDNSASIFTAGSPTITAVVDDGDIAVGDLVDVSGFTASVLSTAGVAGNDAYYLGTDVFNGFPVYIFGEANTVGGNTAFLAVSADLSAASGATVTALTIWAGSPTSLGTSSACFSAGTEISTPKGATLVEALAIGDMVTTATGAAAAVKWIGHQTIGTRLGLQNHQPVRIRAGALGGGLPHSDLTVTADHGMVFFPSSREAVGEQGNDGLVINASALVNGTTIDFVPLDELPDSFTVYHIETEAHDVILANGAAAETFMDAAGRGAFDNHAEYLALYGAERIIPEMDHPRITAQRLVPDAIRARLQIAMPDPALWSESA